MKFAKKWVLLTVAVSVVQAFIFPGILQSVTAAFYDVIASSVIAFFISGWFINDDGDWHWDK